MKKKILLSVAAVFIAVLSISLLFGSTYLDKYGPIGAKIFGLVTIKNTHLDSYILKLQNKDGTQRFYVDSAGAVYGSSSFAVIDSFTTTALLDTVSVKGVTVGDVLVVSQYSPLWSNVGDTSASPYTAYVLSTDNVVVKRSGRYGQAALKSGAQYGLIVVNR